MKDPGNWWSDLFYMRVEAILQVNYLGSSCFVCWYLVGLSQRKLPAKKTKQFNVGRTLIY